MISGNLRIFEIAFCNGNSMENAMDNVDIEILNELRHNARIPNKKLAEKIHLSPSAVLERVRKLQKNGVIKDFVTRIDNRALGYNISVFIELKIERNLGQTPISKCLVRIPEILEVYDIAGDYDYLLKVVAADSESLRKTMHAIGSIPGVISSNTKLILSNFKSESTPEIRKK